jgi:hypothetical protein
MLAQAVHAGQHFCLEHYELAKSWSKESDYLICLSVANELKLSEIISQAQTIGIRYSVFREPDLNNSITAIVLEPGILSKNICRKLSLAFKK